MIHFIILLIIFMNPGNGTKSEVKLLGIEAPNAQVCQVQGQLAANSLSQRADVSFVEAQCIEVKNPNEVVT